MPCERPPEAVVLQEVNQARDCKLHTDGHCTFFDEICLRHSVSTRV